MKIEIPKIITDQFIIQYFYNEIKNKIIKTRLHNIPASIQNYLNVRYNDSSCIKETIYRIIKQIDKHPACQICGKPLKYFGHSISKIFYSTCGDKNCLKNIRQEKYKQTCLIKYGSTNIFGSEYGKEKLKETWLEKYGVTNPQANKEIREKSLQAMKEKYKEDINNPFQLSRVKEKIQKTKLELYGDSTYTNHKKMIQTCLEKYGVTNPSFVQEINNKKRNTFFNNFNTKEKLNELKTRREQTCLEKYGVKNYFLTDRCKELSHNLESHKKRYQTKKKNHTFTTSKIEQQFKEYLEQNYPNDFEYQYRSELYPFNCDFYIKSLDLYIEIQGTWQHGNHPFNEMNNDDIEYLNFLKNKEEYALNVLKLKHTSYTDAINTWLISDVKKRNIAKQNNLNYLEIFSNNLNECILQLNNYLIKI